jgi:type III restriction enzyme
MVINIQAFNSSGKDNRRIYDVLDDFQSRRPIDVISECNPFLILDEPQKMEGKKTLEALQQFKPMAIARYSATHKTTHNKIHRLDAIDAYNKKLVKKITVRGISVKGLAGTNPYTYFDSIELSKQSLLAKVEIEVKQASGIKRVVKKVGHGDDLLKVSNGLAQYKGYVVSNIDAASNRMEFVNGVEVSVGEATGDVTEETIRRIQIRETIKAHLEKERQLYSQNIKVLSLFFIDEVAKYRDYGQEDQKGVYARVFEEEYANAVQDELRRGNLGDALYVDYLKEIAPSETHNGYFSIDKKTSQMVNPEVKSRGEDAGLADDESAYNLILKAKERLLSFSEPTRFIFSHSALREGWDNPNVFVMCMLKHSDNTISRRQEVGRGLRLAVNQEGERIDAPSIVHQINELTVVASESYADFVSHLQKEISEALSDRPIKADAVFFLDKVILSSNGEIVIDEPMAKLIYKYLIKHDYIDDNDQLTNTYEDDLANGSLAELPDSIREYGPGIFALLENVLNPNSLPIVSDSRRGTVIELNENFEKKAFKSLWGQINHKAVYRVEFVSEELVAKAIQALDKELEVTPLQYTVQAGSQRSRISDEDVSQGDMFNSSTIRVETHSQILATGVKYDILGTVAAATGLTRKSVGLILSGIRPELFAKYRVNPENFMAECSRIVNEQKATMVVQHISYDAIERSFDTSIFTAGQLKIDLAKSGGKLRNHIYDYALTESKGEEEFASQLDQSTDVEVFAKLPRGFYIPTPVGDYNPDWAIAFKEGSVKHVYFVAETKGSMSSLQLRQVELSKIECAKKFFDELNNKHPASTVRYGVVSSFGKLMEVISG